MSSKRELPSKFVGDKQIKEPHEEQFPATIYPSHTQGIFNFFGLHMAYYRNETAMLYLVNPPETLPTMGNPQPARLPGGQMEPAESVTEEPPAVPIS
jgi:hypothetical protein